MVHDAWTMAVGNAADLIKTAARLEAVSEQIAGIYQRRTGLELAKVREMMATETEFNATEAVEFGFATEIFEAERLAAHYDPDRHHFKNPPSATLQPRQAEAQRAIAEMKMRLV